jgi:hypothetical protein
MIVYMESSLYNHLIYMEDSFVKQLVQINTFFKVKMMINLQIFLCLVLLE